MAFKTDKQRKCFFAKRKRPRLGLRTTKQKIKVVKDKDNIELYKEDFLKEVKNKKVKRKPLKHYDIGHDSIEKQMGF